MALPQLSLPTEDVRARLWLPVTVRVAWELLLARVRVRPSVLADAREHVLRSLPTGVTPEEAEELAGVYTREYQARARDQRYQRQPLDPDLGFAVPRRWRELLVRQLDPVADAVLRMHYGDGLSMEDVGRHAAIHKTVLAGARDGLRESLRAIALMDSVHLDDWVDARVDGLLRRLATLAGPSCPGPAGLLSEAGREHAGRCPRCSRAVRLIRQGVLAPTDLFVPDGDQLQLPGRVSIMALLLHPDGRKHRDAVEAALPEGALDVGQDAWLLPADEADALGAALRSLAEQGTPPRHHLRAAVVEGPGRWRRGVILGPVPVAAIEEARSRPWAELDRVGELPAPLPPPPSAAGWWAVALASAGVAALAGTLVFSPARPDPAMPVSATWTHTDAGWDLRFDADELAVIDLVVQDDLGLRALERDVRVDKGAWATGEGDFALEVPAAAAAIITTADGVDDLDDLIAAARVSADPVAALAESLRDRHPTADVAVTPALPEQR